MRGRTITVTDRGTTVVLRGYRVAELARCAGLRPVFNGVAGGWVADGDRLADLLAYLDSRRVAYTVEAHADLEGFAHVEDRGAVGLQSEHLDLHEDEYRDLFGGLA